MAPVPSSTSSSAPRRLELHDMRPFDGLRGVCAMAIFLGHQTLYFLNWNPGIEFLQAVSLFFLLSGIPLVRLYASQMDSSVRVRKFWIKRADRLGPIYYATLCLNLSVLLCLVKTPDIPAALTSFAGCAFFLQTWFISLINVGGVLWQVAVFVYGYLCFPFVAQWIRNWSSTSLISGVATLWLVSAALWAIVWGYPSDARMLYW